MKYGVKLDPLADNDLEEIFNFVADNDSYSAAYNLISELQTLCGKLEAFPERGHKIPEITSTSSSRYLELHYKTYRIIYQITDNLVYIHAVIDGRRNVRDVLIQRNLRVI